MAKKSTKREFDWRTYTKPARLLTPEQEAALADGPLRPLLDLALAQTGIDLEIRARQFTLYYRGSSLARVSGAPGEFSAALDRSLDLPRAERAGAEQLETVPLTTEADVASLVTRLAEVRARLDAFASAEEPSARDVLTAFAQANRREADSAELLVVDIEYQYGRRRFDFVAIRRAAGVGGAGAFTTPRLVIGELYSGHRPPRSATGLTSFGAEAAEFAHALSGEHLARAQAEIAMLTDQRTRLGLMPETPFSHVTDGMPELIIAFTDPAFSDASFDQPLAELHDRAVARHFPADLIRFAAVGEARAESDDTSLRVTEDDVLPYRAFKGMRKRLGQ